MSCISINGPVDDLWLFEIGHLDVTFYYRGKDPKWAVEDVEVEVMECGCAHVKLQGISAQRGIYPAILFNTLVILVCESTFKGTMAQTYFIAVPCETAE